MNGARLTLSVPAFRLLAAAWIVALVATLAALFIGEVMGKAPCTLCWYQRIAMFPLALILGVAALDGDRTGVRYGLPLALAGLAFAAWHSLLFAGVIPEAIKPCTRDGPSCSGPDMTLFGWLPIPYLALAAFAMIAALLTLSLRSNRQ